MPPKKTTVKEPWLDEAAIRLLENIVRHGTSGNAEGAAFLAKALARLFTERGYETAAERIQKAIDGTGTKLVLAARDERELAAMRTAIRSDAYDRIRENQRGLMEALKDFSAALGRSKRKPPKPRKITKKIAGIPAVGQDVYIPTALYIDHGADDFAGGLCQVKTVEDQMSAGEMVPFIEVVERPGHFYNWEFLKDEQARLRKEYGNRRGRPDPDNHPDSNRGF